jgi:two-component system, NarL family, response regulator NreC
MPPRTSPRLVGAPDSTRSAERPIGVVLADDHDGVRRSLRKLLDGEEDIEVLAEASHLDEASRALRAHRPHVVVLDLMSSGGVGRTMTGELLAAAPSTRIVVVSMNDSPAFARALLEVGVAGFVLKELADSDLPQAIRTVVQGTQYVSPRMAAGLRVPGNRGGSGRARGERDA